MREKGTTLAIKIVEPAYETLPLGRQLGWIGEYIGDGGIPTRVGLSEHMLEPAPPPVHERRGCLCPPEECGNQPIAPACDCRAMLFDASQYCPCTPEGNKGIQVKAGERITWKASDLQPDLTKQALAGEWPVEDTPAPPASGDQAHNFRCAACGDIPPGVRTLAHFEIHQKAHEHDCQFSDKPIKRGREYCTLHETAIGGVCTCSRESLEPARPDNVTSHTHLPSGMPVSDTMPIPAVERVLGPRSSMWTDVDEVARLRTIALSKFDPLFYNTANCYDCRRLHRVRLCMRHG